MTTSSKTNKVKNFEKKLIESWYNQSLPYIDFDNPTADGFCNEYQMTQRAWVKSITKDLRKYYVKNK